MPAVLRFLLPIIAALALVGQPVATWASSGIVGDTSCCCPDPHKCDCHDRRGDHHGGPSMKRCSNGPIELVAPVLLVAIVPPAAPRPMAPRALATPTSSTAPMREPHADRPEKPPS